MNINVEVLNCLYNNILEERYDDTERLLSISNADPNEIIEDKAISLLHLAAGVEPEDHAENVVRLLLRHGGDPNKRSEEGMTALHIASAWGRVTVCRILLEAGADPNLPDSEGRTPLKYAAEHDNPSVLECFLDYESNDVDCEGSPKKYTLQFDKIIVSNGALEGEYYFEDMAKVEPFRKSDYIKEWFARSPKLDSPVATETKPCDTDSDRTPTNTIRSKNSSTSTGETLYKSNGFVTSKSSTLYESCLSLKDDTKNSKRCSNALFTKDNSYDKDESTEKKSTSLMSGIKPLIDSLEKEDLECRSPSSVNLLPHRNYESRTNLKTKTCEILQFHYNEEQNCDENSLTLSDVSDADLMSQISDNFNKAIVISDTSLESGKSVGSVTARSHVSIKSNSSSQFNRGFVNTSRRKYVNSSSCLSGNMSLTNETVPSVAEEYKYEDKEAGVALIEKRILVNTSSIKNVNSSANLTGGALSSISSTASSLPMSLHYDTDGLRRELKSLGITPGPITSSTKRVYLKRLKNVRKNPMQSGNEDGTAKKVYSIELEKTFKNPNWNTNLSEYVALERKLAEQFEAPNPNKKWREGTVKASFTYLLMDPRISDNLPCRADSLQPSETWKNFIDSIFYIGKGKRSRPYAHLYDAVTLHNSGQTSTDNEKVKTILDIWREKCGVVCLHIFQNVIPVEAYTREASMIEVMGLKNLKNIKLGNYYGSVVTWSLKQKKMLGLYLLYRAMLIFLSEGERQLRPEDIKS